MGLTGAALATSRAGDPAAALGHGSGSTTVGDRAAAGHWFGGGPVLVGLAAIAGLLVIPCIAAIPSAMGRF